MKPLSRRWLRLFRNISSCLVISATTLVLFALAGEFYLRQAVFDPDQYYVRKPGWQIIFRSNPEATPGVHGDAHFSVNKLGLRGDLIRSDSEPTILAVGGSTTADALLSLQESWVYRLQTRLRQCMPKAWAGNMGRAGTNAFHHALQLDKILPRLARMDKVLVLAGLNDMLHDFRIHHPKDLPDDWDLQQAFMHRPADSRTFPQNTALYQTLNELWKNRHKVFDADARFVRIADLGDQTAGYRARKSRVQQKDFIHDVPDMKAALTRYRDSLSRMAETAKRENTQLVLITQPAIWKRQMNEAELKLLYAGGQYGVDQWSLNSENKWFHHLTMKKMLDRYNDVMRSVCSESDSVRCIDLDRQLPKVPDNFYDDFHFSEAGADNVSTIVAMALYPDCVRKTAKK